MARCVTEAPCAPSWSTRRAVRSRQTSCVPDTINTSVPLRSASGGVSSTSIGRSRIARRTACGSRSSVAAAKLAPFEWPSSVILPDRGHRPAAHLPETPRSAGLGADVVLIEAGRQPARQRAAIPAQVAFLGRPSAQAQKRRLGRDLPAEREQIRLRPARAVQRQQNLPVIRLLGVEEAMHEGQIAARPARFARQGEAGQHQADLLGRDKLSPGTKI